MHTKNQKISSGINLSAWVTAEQYKRFKEDADKYGYEMSSLLRLRLFGKVKGLRLIRRPSYNARLLGDAIGHLIGLAGALNQNGSNIGRIAHQLDQDKRDFFGLDGALRRFDQLGDELTKLLHLIDAALTGRPKIARLGKALHEEKNI